MPKDKHPLEVRSHEADVRRGLSGEEKVEPPVDAETDLTIVYTDEALEAEAERQRAREEAATRLAGALNEEFKTLFGGAKIEGADAAWMLAANGVLDKMQADITRGDDGIVTLRLP